MDFFVSCSSLIKAIKDTSIQILFAEVSSLAALFILCLQLLPPFFHYALTSNYISTLDIQNYVRFFFSQDSWIQTLYLVHFTSFSPWHATVLVAGNPAYPSRITLNGEPAGLAGWRPCFQFENMNLQRAGGLHRTKGPAGWIKERPGRPHNRAGWRAAQQSGPARCGKERASKLH